jgi:ACS family pantothenate transporter-like MFS transporter
VSFTFSKHDHANQTSQRSPCYVGLKNNVVTRLLETTLSPFPPGTPDVVSHSVLKEYIQDTAVKTGVDEITKYDTEVKELSKSGDEWVVESVTLARDSSNVLTATSSIAVRSKVDDCNIQLIIMT